VRRLSVPTVGKCIVRSTTYIVVSYDQLRRAQERVAKELEGAFLVFTVLAILPVSKDAY